MNINSFRKQPDLKARHRVILVDWLMQLQHTLRLREAVLFLSVNLLDRFLCKRECQLHKAKGLALAALVIAHKFEEEEPLSFEEILFGCGVEANLEQLELLILKTLDWEIYTTTVFTLIHTSPLSKRERTRAVYLAEKSLLDLEIWNFSPSQVATAAIRLARNEPADSDCTDCLLACFRIPNTTIAKKYRLNRFIVNWEPWDIQMSKHGIC